MKIVTLSTVCLIFLIDYVISESKGGLCRQMNTCGDCLEAGPTCSWCKHEPFTKKDSYSRCNLASLLKANGCPDPHIVSPPSTISMDKNLPPRNSGENNKKTAIQLSPQKVTIKLRPNSPYKMQVNFKQAENYPVDLYFVMDLSQSMQDDRMKLAELGVQLAENLQEITSDFRIGYGSFVDKESMPFISIIPGDLKSPCRYDYNSTTKAKCASPYGFINQMKLAPNTKRFQEKVMKSEISGNLDSPEGGFDALMQAIVCKKDIGWRTHSRKMILFATDNDFHLAGDGKLAGIVTPNDGKCHMKNNRYEYSLHQDYPSISHIARTVADNKVNVIFAVTKFQTDHYKKLSEKLEGAVTGTLKDDSSNVVELVRDNYEKISGRVELKVDGDDDISVKFHTKCLDYDEFVERPFCDGLKIGKNISYEMTIEMKKCPSASLKNLISNKRTIAIYPVGLSEKLIVDIDLICQCDCEKPMYQILNSDKCEKHGTFECGACTCNKGNYGKICECNDSTSDSDNVEHNKECKNSKMKFAKPCNGNGNCVCGECECHRIQPGSVNRYTGKFCNCNNFNCLFKDDKLCSGNGRCECGTCVCDPGYTFSDCSCYNRTDTCVSDISNKLCNGFGECVCGQCVCTDKYSGTHCDICPRCKGECSLHKECALCMIELGDNNPVTDEELACASNCTHVTLVDEFIESSDLKECHFSDVDNCHYYFQYNVTSKDINAKRMKECPEPINIWIILLFILLAIFLIGMALLLIWKVIVTLKDRREYANFMKEQSISKYKMEENPIYKKATSNYNNPTYTPLAQNDY